jgi:hypothetical protein
VRHSNSSSYTETDCEIQIHGWDSTGGFWHGPTQIAPQESGFGPISRRLARSQGPFHGTISCRVPGSIPFAFQTAAYDLTDSGLAVLHLDGLQAPIGALAIVPAHRRCRLRSEFAFGLVAHLSFLSGLITPDSELQILEYIEDALRSEPRSTLAFTLEAAHADTDVSIVLATYLDRLSTAMLSWLRMNDSEAAPRRSAPLCAPERAMCAPA